MPRPRSEKKITPLSQEEKIIVEENIPLIWWVVRRNRPRDEHEASEWVQEGVFGFVYALRSHDPQKGSLSTWAKRCIQGSVSRFRIERGGIIHLPNSIRNEEHKECARKVVRCTSLSSSAESGLVQKEGPSYDDSLSRAMRRLHKEERALLELKVGLGFKLREISEMYGVSNQRISKRVEKALSRLREEYFSLEGIDG